jgi:hypothetical protein
MFTDSIPGLAGGELFLFSVELKAGWPAGNKKMSGRAGLKGTESINHEYDSSQCSWCAGLRQQRNRKFFRSIQRDTKSGGYLLWDGCPGSF